MKVSARALPKKNAGYSKGKMSAVMGIIALAIIVLWAKPKTNTLPEIDPELQTNGLPAYPYSLVPGEPVFDFPAAEGRLQNINNDTWFLEGVLTGQESGKKYSFIVVFFSGRVFGFIPLEFYSLAVYDLNERRYGTYTKYGLLKSANGYLDLKMPLDGDTNATWTTKLNAKGQLIPFNYALSLPGTDQNGESVQLTIDVAATRPPVPVGADDFNGKITVLRQENTYSYFQTGMQINGQLTWGDISEKVTGNVGHIDRQMFPKFSGSTTNNPHNLSHEWRTFFLSNGTDFSSWRQFDRRVNNEEYSYSGATTYHPDRGAEHSGDIRYEYHDFERVVNPTIKPLLANKAEVQYFPTKHRLSSVELNLDLIATPIVKEALLAFPVEYYHTPVEITGTQHGTPVEGIGSLELTLSFYRDYELINVLEDSLNHLPTDHAISTPEVIALVAELRDDIENNRNEMAETKANEQLRMLLTTLPSPEKDKLIQILDDLIAVIGKYD